MNVYETAAELVSRERIEEHYRALGKIGIDPKGGITRLAYSNEENEAHGYFGEQMEKAGLDIRWDRMANIFGIIGGEERQVILTGSHVDSVKTGGNADGGAGCVAALEALTCITNLGIKLKYSVGCCVIRAEESDRFGQALIGSKGIFRPLTEKEFQSKDENGVTLDEAWRITQGYNLDEDRLDEADHVAPDLKCFIELHPEQSSVLEQKGKQIGIVNRIAAPERWRFKVYGRRDHSGATPMHTRRDANQGMAEMMNLAERIAKENPPTVATIGKCSDVGGSINTISGEAYFTIDCRDDDINRREKVMDEIRREIDEIAKRRQLTVEYESISSSRPVALDQGIIEVLENSCKGLGIEYMSMRSGASHDTAIFQSNGIPSGMIFIPSINGISHAPDEQINIDDLVKGTQVLLATVLYLGQGGYIKSKEDIMKEISEVIEKQLHEDSVVDMFLEGHSLDITLNQFNIGSKIVEQIPTYTGYLELCLDYQGQRHLLEGTKARVVLAVHEWDSLTLEQIPALFRERGQIVFSIYREAEVKPLYKLATEFGKESGKVTGDQKFIMAAYKLIYDGKDESTD